MNYLEFSRTEWEEITGADETGNFTYRVFDEDDGYIEHEVTDDDAQIRVFIDEEEKIMEVSAHGFVPNMERGSSIYQDGDGWGVINEWRIDGEWYNETITAIKAQA